eukprot:COSAG01_NODE_326_length_18790_cov_10.366005_23_plen_78_part_00
MSASIAGIKRSVLRGAAQQGLSFRPDALKRAVAFARARDCHLSRLLSLIAHHPFTTPYTSGQSLVPPCNTSSSNRQP